MRRFLASVAFLSVFLVLSGPVRAVPEEDESLGHKIKKLFVPTPTPHPKHKASPSPSPHHHKTSTSSPRPAHGPSASPKASATPSPTPSPTPEETPTPSATPEEKEKHEAEATEESPTPTVSPHHGGRSHKTAEGHPGKTPSTTKTPTETATPDSRKAGARTTAMSPDRISGYDSYPAPVRRVLDRALALTNDGLTYKYGSADPASGGMDCSGFIYYVLKESGLKDVPRDAREQYIWVRKAGTFEAVLGHSEDTFEIDHLKPGDLLFWTGTYHTDRDPDITHTMIYLGREKGSNQRIMVGSSDGRTYKGQSQNGVSVFDFHVATHRRAESDDSSGPDFAGYGRIPALDQVR